MSIDVRNKVANKDGAHQPDEAGFRSVLPENVDWKPFAPFPLRLDLPWSWVSRRSQDRT